MSITLESHPCPNCRADNSIHIDNCRKCGDLLPWAGTEQTKAGTEPKPIVRKEGNRSKALVFYGLAVFLVLLAVTNIVLHLAGYSSRPQMPGIITLFSAGFFWKLGDNTLMDVKES